MECPESLDEWEEIARKLPLCRITTYEQAKARIEIGAAKSISEAARQIGEETGRNPESIERSIRREEESRETRTLSELSGTDKHKPKDVIATKWTGDQESYTPEKYIKSARVVMGSIQLDPASNDMANETVNAAIFYTKEDDGLEREWSGNIFLNPPYSQPEIKQFINKLLDTVSRKPEVQAILLTNNNTDTSWFHNAAMECAAICLTRGRINFNKPDGSVSQPTNGQTFFYFGENVKAFANEFRQHGLIVRVY